LELGRFQFLNTPTEHTFLSFERFHNLSNSSLSQVGNDNKALVTPKNDNASVSASNGEALVQDLLLFSSVIQAGSSRTCVLSSPAQLQQRGAPKAP